MYRVIVAGSRDFNNYDLLNKTLREYFRSRNIHKSEVEIVSGTARGADQFGEQFAKECNLQVSKFPANWDKYGKSAGYRRNEQMAIYAKESNGILFAFWNGESKGTKHMIDLAYKHGLIVNVINY